MVVVERRGTKRIRSSALLARRRGCARDPSGRCQAAAASARPSSVSVQRTTPSRTMRVASLRIRPRAAASTARAVCSSVVDHEARAIAVVPDDATADRFRTSPGYAVLVGMRGTWDALAGADSHVYVGDPATRRRRARRASSAGSAPTPAAGVCLEVGCGPGRMTGGARRALRPRARARRLAGDARASPRGGAGAECRVPRRRPATGSTASRTRSRNVLVCYLVLQHLPSPRSSRVPRRSSRRVLAPAGRGVRPAAGARGGPRPRAWRADPHRDRAARLRLGPRPDRGAGVRGFRLTERRARPRRSRGRAPRPRARTRARPRRTATAATSSCGSAARDRGRARRLRASCSPRAAIVVCAGGRSRPSTSSSSGWPLHNIVMALLYGGGVRGHALEAIQAWKEALLAVAVARVAWDAVQARRFPFRLGPSTCSPSVSARSSSSTR